MRHRVLYRTGDRRESTLRACSGPLGFGVILYQLLCGSLPFLGKNEAETMRLIQTGCYSLTGPEWQGVSEEARALLAGLFQRLPQNRLGSEQVLQHAWIREQAPKSKGVPLKAMMGNLRAYQGQHHFMRAALRAVATQLDHGKIRELQDVFKKLDTNKDGLLSHEELEAGVALFEDGPEAASMGHAGSTRERVKSWERTKAPDRELRITRLLKELDSDGSGSINYTEFIAAALDRRVYAEEEICWSAFRVFDKDGDNKISHEEFCAVLGDKAVSETLGPDMVRSLMNEVDANNDGFVDFEEFMAMMRTSQGRESRVSAKLEVQHVASTASSTSRFEVRDSTASSIV